MKFDKINIQRITALLTFIICIMIMYWGEKNPAKWEYVIASLAFYYFGYLSRRPHSDEKTFTMWVKICILNLQIWPKQFFLFWYPDLKKYRGKPNLRQKVWVKRDKLKQLKKELKELV